MKRILSHVLIALAMVLTACNSEQSHSVEYLPFQESKDGEWGMISTSGEVLFSEEFSEQPTMAVNGRFMVKNKEGLWEIYTAEAKPKKIGGEYLQAGLFFSDVAPVVEKDQPITLIDLDGNVKVMLDKIGGKSVTNCENFVNGLAKVKAEGRWGVIDTNGELIIAPEYKSIEISTDGYILAVSDKYMDENNNDKIVYTILDKSGKIIGEVKGSKFSATDIVNTSAFRNGALLKNGFIVSPKGDQSLTRAIMGFEGEWVMPPSSKTIFLQEARGNFLIHSDGNGAYGLVNEDGEEIIRAKYSALMFGTDDVLIGRKSEKDGYDLYSLDEEKITDEDYQFIFRAYDGKHFFARMNDNEMIILSKDGKEQKLKVDIYDVSFTIGDTEFESDFMDFDAIINSLQIKNDGFFGLTTNLTGPEAIEVVNNHEGNANLSKEARMYNGYGSDITAFMTSRQYNSVFSIVRDGLITETYGDGVYTYHSPYIYSWTDNKIRGFYYFTGKTYSEKMDGKMEQFADKLISAVKSVGHVVAEGKHAVVVKTEDSNCYYACWTGKDIHLYYGQYDATKLDVTKYDNVTENDDISDGNPKVIGAMQVENNQEEEDYGELESPPADNL